MPETGVAPAARGVLARLRRLATDRLHRRIVAVFLGLLLLVQAASFFAIRHGIESNARRDIAEGMRRGETLLRRLLAQNAQQLREAARLLAADYGFRAAVAASDAETLTDALANQAERIGADVAVFTDTRGRPIASTTADAGRLPLLLGADGGDAAPADRRDARQSRAESGLQVRDGAAFQLVSVPVRAPLPIGQVAMGFALDAALPRDLRELASLRVVFLHRVARPPAASAASPPSPWQPLRVGAEPPPSDELMARLAGGAPPESAVVDGESTALHWVSFGRSGDQETAAVLLRSIDAAVVPSRQLQLVLLAITLAGVAVFAVGSVVTARRILRPIDALSASAQRLADGDYASPVPEAGRDEVGHLARSFETMRVGIHERDAEIRRLAYWDALTGLPNREQFRRLAREQLAKSRRADEPCAVLLLDIDRFKHVNDVLGHAFGDRLLGAIAGRLRGGLLRDHDLLARFGGDEFAVCLPRTDADGAQAIAERIAQAMQQPLTLDAHTVDASAGIGIAAFPAHADDVDLLIGRAELAMYAAKSRQAGVLVYDPALDSASEASLSLLGELRNALDRDELRLFLQPQVSLTSGEVCGAEALVRWQHPRRGLLPPAAFVPFAEQTGFIRELTGWMVDRSAAECARLRAEGRDFRVSVNLSTKDLMDLRLADKLERSLGRSGLAPAALGLEITESAIMEDPQRSLATLQRLDAMGHTLSIDDFGTGYSSLAYLKSLPLHQLKIDRSFVMGMEQDRADLKIVRSTIDLAHNLGYSVVAEGVETAQTWAILRALRCDEAQGYFMARPMAQGAFGPWLDGWRQPVTRLRTEFAELV